MELSAGDYALLNQEAMALRVRIIGLNQLIAALQDENALLRSLLKSYSGEEID